MKTVLIGCGRMGQRHIIAARKLKHEIIGIFDKSTESKKITQKKFKLKKEVFYSNLDKMFKENNAEFCIIATTADTHYKFVLKSVEHGVKFILLEKPIATSIADCEKMNQICKKNKVFISVNHQMRFQKHYTIIKKLLNTKKFGGLKSMNVLAGNIGISMNGMHYMEGFRFLTKEKIIKVNGWLEKNKDKNPRGKKFKDVGGQILAVTKSKKKLYIDASTNQYHGIHVVFIAKNGIITSDELLNQISYTVRNSKYLKFPSYRFGMPSDNKRIKLNLNNMTIESTIEVMKNLIKKKNFVSINEAIESIKITQAAYMSSERNGITINLSDYFNKKRKFSWA